MQPSTFVLVLLFAAHAGLTCASREQEQGREVRSADLLGRSPLAPFLPHAAANPQDLPSDDDVRDLVREFAQRQQKRSGDGGVPSSLTPVVIVPSLIGSKLQAQLDGLRSKHWYCWSEWRDWFTVWMNFDAFMPMLINCWYEQMALHFDDRSGRSFDTPGVNMRIVDYGGVTGVDYLDDYKTIGIWNTTISVLTELGWTVGKNLRAAPYDWRTGPATFVKKDWPLLRALIEDTYTINNNSKVACASLSMGGPYFLGFLNQQSQAWKDKYLHSFVSIDGAFGGSPSAASALVSLDGWWASKFPNPDVMRAVVQSWPSIVWMMPIPQIYGNQVWVSTLSPARNYTAADFTQLLMEAGGYNASKIYHNLLINKWFTFDAPGVECHAFFGTGVATPMRTTYNTTRFDGEPRNEYGNGDGVVPESGLRMLELWRGKQEQAIYSYPIQGLFHGEGVQNVQVLRMFLEVLSSH